MSRRWRQRPLVVLAGTALAACVGAGCSRDAPPEAPVEERLTVRVATATLGTIRDTIAAAGTTVPAIGVDLTVHAPEPALIAEMPKNQGDPVQAGDLLVRFDIASITQEVTARQLEMAEATRRLEAARTAANELRPLYERGLAARNQMEARESAVLAAQAVVTQARAQLDLAVLQQERAVVRARFPGIVAMRWHNAGDFVTNSGTDPIIRVIDPTRLQVAVMVTPTEAARVLPGMPATLTLLTEGRTEASSVVYIPGGGSPNATASEVRLALPANSTLAVDTPLRAEILVEQRDNVVIVPPPALRRDDTGSYVMIAGADGRAHRREVQVGLSTRDQIQIVLGVAPGDRVITTGLDELNDGMAINVDDAGSGQ